MSIWEGSSRSSTGSHRAIRSERRPAAALSRQAAKGALRSDIEKEPKMKNRKSVIERIGRGISVAAAVVLAGCAATSGTKVTAADASSFTEHVTTRQQVIAKLGDPRTSSTGTMGPGVCDYYQYTSMNAFSGASENTSATFCYDQANVLTSKMVQGSQSK